MGSGAAAGSRRLRQLGVEYAITGLGRPPWEEETLRTLLDRYKKNGIAVDNIMISGFDSAKEELRSTEDLFRMQTIVIISAE